MHLTDVKSRSPRRLLPVKADVEGRRQPLTEEDQSEGPAVSQSSQGPCEHWTPGAACPWPGPGGVL